MPRNRRFELHLRVQQNLTWLSQRLLYAKLDLESISRCGTIEKALNSIKEPPKLLDDRYEAHLTNIETKDGSSKDLATEILMWLTNSVRHLSIIELQHALAIAGNGDTLDKSRMLGKSIVEDVCDGLVVVDLQSNRVRFFHDTAYSYFQRHPHIGGVAAQRLLSGHCISYMMLKTFKRGRCESDEDMNRRLDRYPLYSYSTRNWGHHAAGNSWNSDLQKHAVRLLATTSRFESAIQGCGVSERRYPGYSQNYTSKLTDLHVAASFGLTKLTRYLLKQQPDIMRVDSDGKTAVHIAAETGFTDVVQQLLREKPSVAEVRDRFGQTALHLAASNGHTATMKMIMTMKRCDINSLDNDNQTPLHLAVLNGQLSTVDELLTNYKADPDKQDTGGKTSLHIAAWTGNKGVVKLLLHAKAEHRVRRKDKNGLTALHYAACMGHKDVVQILLDNSARVNALDGGRWSSLHWASVRRHDITDPWTIYLPQCQDKSLGFHSRAIDSKISQMLHVGDYIVNTETFLVESFEGMVWGVCETEKVERPRSHLGEPKEKLSSILSGLRNGSQPLDALLFTMQDELSAMQCNDSCSHEEVVRLLLSNDISVGTPVQGRWAVGSALDGQIELHAIHLAMLSGHRAVAQLLIEKGIDTQSTFDIKCGDVNQFHWKGRFQALHLAIILGEEAIARRLLENPLEDRRPDPNAHCQVDLYAAEVPHDTLLSNDSLRALHIAAISLKADTLVPMLLENGAEVNFPYTLACDNEFFEMHVEMHPLFLAIASGHEEAVKALISAGVDIEAGLSAQFGFGLKEQRLEFHFVITPLEAAIVYDLQNITEALIGKGASVHHRHSLSWTKSGESGTYSNEMPLHKAIYRKNEDIVCHILEAGADPNAVMYINIFGIRIDMTALHYSALNDGAVTALLCKYGADVNGSAEFQIHWDTEQKEDIPPLKCLSHMGRLTPLHFAILFGADGSVRKLCENKADVNASVEFNIELNMEKNRTIRGQVRLGPLHMALLKGSEDMIEYLIGEGAGLRQSAEINISVHFEMEDAYLTMKIKGTFTPVHLAVLRDLPVAIKAMDDLGMSVNEVSSDSVIDLRLGLPLKHDSQEATRFEYLMEGDIAPIHLAALLGHHAIVKVLLECEANTEAQCMDGRRAADIARDLGWDLVLNALSGEEAEPPSRTILPQPEAIQGVFPEHGVELLYGNPLSNPRAERPSHEGEVEAAHQPIKEGKPSSEDDLNRGRKSKRRSDRGPSHSRERQGSSKSSLNADRPIGRSISHRSRTSSRGESSHHSRRQRSDSRGSQEKRHSSHSRHISRSKDSRNATGSRHRSSSQTSRKSTRSTRARRGQSFAGLQRIGDFLSLFNDKGAESFRQLSDLFNS